MFGPLAVVPAGSTAALVDKSPEDIPLERLGGTLKVCKLLTEVPSNRWEPIKKHIINVLPQHLPYIPEGKIRLGLSVYDMKIPVAEINKTGLAIKNVIKDFGRSVRVVPNNEPALSTAQTIHNQLTGQTGLELVIIGLGDRDLLAQAVKVQNIEAYAARDQKRPKRDARVGMLPPKLAQIIINISTGLPVDQPATITVLDPFCGTGVILQEALLMGYNAVGTDLDQRMVDYAEENINWLRQNKPELSGLLSINQGDATAYKWPKGVSCISSETYLGRPFSSQPKPEVLNEVVRDVDTIHKKFLQNITHQTRPGFRMCVAVPAWKTSSGFRHLPSLDHLNRLGYTRQSFVHASDDQLIYHRPDQIVGRELVTLIRK